jgi:hypothetical protein
MVASRRIRRLPVALLVVAATMAGAATALVSTAPHEMPGSFELPEAGLGDRGAYRVTLLGDWSRSAEGFPELDWRTPWDALRFEWAEAGELADAEGGRGPADVLRVQTRAWDLNVFSDAQPWTLANSTVETFFRSGEGEPFKLLRQGSDEGFADPATILGVPLPGDRFGSRSQYAWASYPVGGRPLATDCVADFPLQGLVVPAEGVVRAPKRPCATHLGSLFGPGSILDFGLMPDAWVARGWQSLGGTPVVRLDGDHMDVWLNPALPVPLRFEVAAAGTDRSARYDLVAFEAGGQQRLARGAWTGGWDAPAALPMRPWGLDEQGMESPFPAEQAFARMREDPLWSAFLRGNPDAYLLETASATSTLYGQTERSWRFTITNGTAAVEGVARQSVPEWADGLPEPARSAAASHEVAAAWTEPEAIPPRPQGTPMLPTALAAAARWREAGGQGTANGWSYALVGDGLGGSAHAVGAGSGIVQHRLVDPAAPGEDALSRFNSLNVTTDWAWMDAEGDLRVQWASTWDTASGDPILPQQAPEAAPASALAAPRGWVPTAAQAAGAGAVGVLAGLLYYLWPTLRAGVLGLFSRVTGPELLESPARASLVALVQANPGIHFKQMQRLSGMGNGVLVHHLHKLTGAGLLVARRMGKYTCYFAPGASREGLAAVEALKAPGARRVLDTVRTASGLGPEAIAQRSGLAVSTVHYHVQRLERAGLVQVDREGRLLRVRTAGAAGAAA